MSTSLTSCDDRQLLHLTAQKDLKAFDELLKRYEYKVFSFCHKLLKDKCLAEEITQDIFVQLWQEADTSFLIQSLPAWLYRLSKNKSINLIKQQLARLKREQLFSGEQDLIVEGAPLEESNRREELISYFLPLLPEKTRLVLELKLYEQLSNEEIANRLGISAHTVKNHLSNSYQQLRLHISRHLIAALLTFGQFNYFLTQA